MSELLERHELWVSWIVGLVGVLVAVAGILNTRALYKGQIKRARMDATAQLHAEVFDPAVYTRVISPVYRARLKWFFLEQPHRQAYREAVIGTWSNLSGVDALHRFTDDADLSGDVAERYYLTPLKSGDPTEKDAVNVFVRFWSRLQDGIDAGLIDQQAARRLFRELYLYYQDFLAEFRDGVRANLAEGEHVPHWVTATERLDVFFGVAKGKRAPTPPPQAAAPKHDLP